MFSGCSFFFKPSQFTLYFLFYVLCCLLCSQHLFSKLEWMILLTHIPTGKETRKSKTKEKKKKNSIHPVKEDLTSACTLVHTVQSLSCVHLLATPWTEAHQGSLSITNTLSLLKLTSIVTVMPSNHLIRYWPLLLLPSIFPNISTVQLLSRVRLFATPWIAARQASLSITNSRSSIRLMCIESVMPSSHLILCRPLLLLPPIPPSISLFIHDCFLQLR